MEFSRRKLKLVIKTIACFGFRAPNARYNHNNHNNLFIKLTRRIRDIYLLLFLTVSMFHVATHFIRIISQTLFQYLQSKWVTEVQGFHLICVQCSENFFLLKNAANKLFPAVCSIEKNGEQMQLLYICIFPILQLVTR